MYESDDKMVSHPDHYQSETGLEVIEAIEAFTFDLKGIEAVDTGNIIKYACRWKKRTEFRIWRRYCGTRSILLTILKIWKRRLFNHEKRRNYDEGEWNLQ